MNALHCPPHDRLSAYYQGKLSDEESDLFIDHLSQCLECQTTLESSAESSPTIDDSLLYDLKRPFPENPFRHEVGCQEGLMKSFGAYAIGETTASSVEDEIPERIGEYEILRWLGQGGMGVVYLAKHEKLGRQVALKVLSSRRLSDKKARQRFVSEMQAVGQLNHPGIVAAYDAREIDGIDVLITEYIEGWDLSEILRKTGPLPIPIACEIARRVAESLQYTSDKGYVHRDVKPSNIMLSQTGEIKLLDLGLARLQWDDTSRPDVTQTGQTMGTADYIAPEQITESRTVGIASDLYALGATLYKLVTGRPPFSEPTYTSVFAKMNAHVYASPASVLEFRRDAPKRLAKLVHWLLEKNPTDRPASPNQVADQLTEFTKRADLRSFADQLSNLPSDCEAKQIHERPSTATSMGASRWLPPFIRSNPLLAAGLGGGFGFCLGILLTITNPDGTQTKIELPKGSRVAISDGDENANSTSAEEAPKAGIAMDAGSSDETPVVEKPTIEFAILLSKSDVLTTSRQGELVKLRPGVEHQSLYVDFQGEGDFVCIDADRGARLQVGGEHGKFKEYQHSMDGKSIVLVADEQLASYLSILSIASLDRHLGVIVDNEVICAPIVHSRFASTFSLRGQRSTIESFEQILQELEIPQGRVTPSITATGSVPTSQKPKTVMNRSAVCLKEIGLAFHHFYNTHGRFPASRTIINHPGGDPSSAVYPMSWRVAILPFIEQSELFNRYNPLEPWDSPSNSLLLNEMPSLYRSPHAPAEQPQGEANFLGIVGQVPRSSFPSAQFENVSSEDLENQKSDPHSKESNPLTEQQFDIAAMPLQIDLAYQSSFGKLSTITDGTSNTIMVVESSTSVPWTKPMDFEYTQASDMEKLRRFEGTPFLVLKADGSILELPVPMHPQLFYELVTKAGGEVIDFSKFEVLPEIRGK